MDQLETPDRQSGSASVVYLFAGNYRERQHSLRQQNPGWVAETLKKKISPLISV
jgi:hypothetical protein